MGQVQEARSRHICQLGSAMVSRPVAHVAIGEAIGETIGETKAGKAELAGERQCYLPANDNVTPRRTTMLLPGER